MVDIDKKVILLLPSKTGTNSIKKCFIESGFNFAQPIKKITYPVYHSTLKEIIEIYDIDKNNLNEYKILHFVRNPFERFISAWIHQIEIMGWNNFKLNDIISMVETYKNLSRYDTDKFYEKFYGSVKYKDNFYKNNNWGGLRFWWEQNWWNDLEANINFFKLEDIKFSTKKISEYIECDLKELDLIRPNSNKNENIDYSIYKKEFENRIFDLYKADYIKYNYEF